MGFNPDLPIRVAHLKGVTLEADRAQLCTDLAAEKDPVIILDPWVSVSGHASENDTDEMKVQVAFLEELQRANTNALILVCHHASRTGASGEGSKVTASRGSTTLPAWADVILFLEHVSTPRGLGLVQFNATMAKNRDGERDYTIGVSISLGSGIVTYESSGDAAKAKMDEAVERAQSAVRSAGGPVTKTALAKAIGGRRTATLNLVDRLVTDGLLVLENERYSLSEEPLETAPQAVPDEGAREPVREPPFGTKNPKSKSGSRVGNQWGGK
jgi:hypothetical protein